MKRNKKDSNKSNMAQTVWHHPAQHPKVGEKNQIISRMGTKQPCSTKAQISGNLAKPTIRML